MNRTLAISVTGLSLAAFCIAADAEQLPKSGTFSINSGWKSNGEILQVAKGNAVIA